VLTVKEMRLLNRLLRGRTIETNDDMRELIQQVRTHTLTRAARAAERTMRERERARAKRAMEEEAAAAETAATEPEHEPESVVVEHKPRLIPSVLATNREDSMKFCADALAVPMSFLTALIGRKLIEAKRTESSLMLRLSEAARIEVRRKQLEGNT